VKIVKQIVVHIQQGLIRFLLLCVRSYQLFLSPLLGSHCRFHPSCSHYCQEALMEHGISNGILLTIKRILRCHPGSKGGYDPVPQKSQTNG